MISAVFHIVLAKLTQVSGVNFDKYNAYVWTLLFFAPLSCALLFESGVSVCPRLPERLF